MRWHYIFVILYIGFSIHLVYGQKLYTGTLQDSLQQPISFANVFAYLPDKDSTIVAFTQTDIQGKFTLSCADTNAILQCAFIGYETVHIPLKIYKNASIIVLKPKTFTVQVTEIIAKPPIKEIGDTLVFNADTYKDGSERTVEDLIRKIPGFEVSNNGKIFFGGKGVQEVLVEGDKIGQKDYSDITQKLKAKIVEDIYVIPDYEENPLLAEFSENPKLAINLTIKDNYKNQWLGSIEAKGGLPKRYAIKGDITNIQTKTKLILDGNYNNIADFPNKNNFYPNTENTDLTTQPKEIFQLYSPSYQIPDILYQNTKIGSGSLMLTQRFKRNFTLNFSTNYHNIQQSYFQILSQTFFLTNYPVFVGGLQLFQQHKKEFYTGAKLTYLPISLKSRFVYEGYFSQPVTQSYNGILGLTFILQKERYKPIYHYHAVEYDYKIKNGHVVLFKMGYRDIHTRSQYNFSSLSNRIYVPATNVHTGGLYQNYSLPTQNYSADVKYIQKKFTLTTCYLYEKQHLFTHIDTLTEIKNQWNYSNAMYYQWNIAYTDVKSKLYQRSKQKKSNKVLTLSNILANVRMQYGQFAYKRDTTLSLEMRQKIWALPHSSIGIILLKKILINFSYQYKINIPKIENFQYAYTLTDFRTLQRGTNEWFPASNHVFSGSSSYINIKKGIILFTLFSYSHTQGRFNTYLTLDSLYTFSSITEKPTHTEFITAYVNIAKSLALLRHRIKFRMPFNKITSPTDINEFQLKNTLYNYQPSISIGSIFSKWINYELNLDYTLAQNRMQLSNTAILTFNNHRIQPNVKCIFRYNEIIAIYQHYFVQQYVGKKLIQSWHWANANVSYIPKKLPKWKFSMVAYNLYNLKFITETQTESNQQIIRRIRMQPRMVLAEINFSFN